MPVRFKVSSEYKENFKPFTMQPVTTAPRSQVTEGVTVEPPIKHKKRIEGPPTSMTCDFYERPPPQEYTLLGQNDKFASNVRYLPKKKLVMDNVNRSQDNKKFIQPDPNEPIRNLDTYNIEKLNLKQVNKAPSPKKAPKVDTSKFVDPPTPLTPRIPKHPAETKQTQTPFDPEVRGQPKVKQTKGQGQNGEVQGQSIAVQTNMEDPVSKKKQSPNKRPVNAKLVEEKRSVAEKEEVKKAALRDKNLKDILDKAPRRERLNARVQTNVERGILDAAPEAMSDYAMRYKAGIAGGRKGRKWSEYQREFEWKNRVPDSPLLAADQVVHKSSTTLAAPKPAPKSAPNSPPKSAPKPRASEYKSQFRTWKMKPTERKDKVDRLEQPDTKKAKLKRSRSMGALADRARYEEDDDDQGRQPVRRSLKDKSEIAAVVSSSHGKLRRTESEYHSNYRAPSQFVYKDGAWHGANHPHAYLSKSTKEDLTSKDKEPSNWYLEVLELRQKAEEYRKRAQGTHFSRAHLAQLLARQAEMWDNDSRSSTSRCSTISALSLETGVHATKQGIKEGQVKKPRPGRSDKGTQLCDNTSTTDYEEQTSEMSGENVYLAGGDNSRVVKKGAGYTRTKGGNPKAREDKGYPRSRGDGSYNNNAYRDNIRANRRNAWSNTPSDGTLTEDGYSGRDDMSTPVNEEEEVDYPTNHLYHEGRLPTPQLQQLNKPVQRHHFDLTTPCVGGAILSSPPPVSSRPMKKYLSKESTRTQIYQNDFSDEEEETRLIGKTYNLNKMAPKTTYGLPSQDTHFLLDEEASTDRPMRTQFVHTPVPSQSEESEVDVEPTPTRFSKKKSSPAPPMPAINEHFGQTYVKPAIIPIHSYDVEKEYYEDDDDEDALSLSVRSIASSCSLASEILERSRHRTNNFWKTTSVAAQ